MYFLQGSFSKGNTLIKALTFGGHEKTYQSWYGVTKEELLVNRRMNPYTYENEIDNKVCKRDKTHADLALC